MLLYIIRHADPDYENDTITPDGHLEAEALSRRMKSYGLDKIFCSPLGRAQDTMQYTAKLLDIEPETEEWTRELSDVFLEDTEWGPLNAWDLPGEAMFDSEAHPVSLDWDALPIWKHLKLREQFAKLGEDSDRFLRKLGYAREGGRYRCVRPNEEKIAVFCHGGFGVTWIAHLLNIPLPIAWAGFWLAPTSVTMISFEQTSEIWAGPKCLTFGDTSHLYESGLVVKWKGVRTRR
ncbi:MAG: histidine phosphatase family protein [Candidatus Latescibacteria bacterium]|nr:histidine phosphatase family protein [Candidatus Latescibacterota bacterium]